MNYELRYEYNNKRKDNINILLKRNKDHEKKDLKKFEQIYIDNTFFICNICYSNDLNIRDIITLKCKHNICRYCYAEIKKNVIYKYKNEIKCPYCREINEIIIKNTTYVSYDTYIFSYYDYIKCFI